VRRLIINADDFGLTSGVNRAIADAHSRGVLTSATLMANVKALTEAIQLSASTPRMGVGCHVVLVDGTPVAPAAAVASLMIPSGARFRDGAGSLGVAAWAGKVDPEHITTETRGQIRKLQAAGISLTHVDTHKHVHIFPAILRGVVQAARECGVHAIRNPFEPLRFSQIFHGGSTKRWLQVQALSVYAKQFRKTVEEFGLKTPDGCLGVVATGALNRTFFRDLIENCPDGTWELVCHPGYADQDLNLVRTRLRESRAVERELLISPEAREILERERIELISYRDLA
jgi:hopanoid biosynthesis associated protein HpnK